MKIHDCSGCGTRLRFSAQVGQKVRCPSCKKIFQNFNSVSDMDESSAKTQYARLNRRENKRVARSLDVRSSDRVLVRQTSCPSCEHVFPRESVIGLAIQCPKCEHLFDEEGEIVKRQKVNQASINARYNRHKQAEDARFRSDQMLMLYFPIATLASMVFCLVSVFAFSVEVMFVSIGILFLVAGSYLFAVSAKYGVSLAKFDEASRDLGLIPTAEIHHSDGSTSEVYNTPRIGKYFDY